MFAVIKDEEKTIIPYTKSVIEDKQNKNEKVRILIFLLNWSVFYVTYQCWNSPFDIRNIDEATDIVDNLDCIVKSEVNHVEKSTGKSEKLFGEKRAEAFIHLMAEVIENANLEANSKKCL